MHLSLINENKVRNLIVYLLEGHAPKIAGLSGLKTDNISGLEPGIWFKVMVLDKVVINCEKHEVSWTVCADKSEDDDSSMEHRIFGNYDHYVYDFDDDLDELFKLASYAIEMNPHSESNEEQKSDLVREYEQTVFRMLHCYVLSRITLYPSDRKQITAAYQTQVTAIKHLEKDALVHTRLSEHYRNKQRTVLELNILPVLDGCFENSELDQEVVEIIERDVEKMLPQVREQLNVLAVKVQGLKLKCKTEEKYQWFFEELTLARQERDIISNTLRVYLKGRESIRTITKHILPKAAALSTALKLYLDFRRKIQIEKDKANDLVKKKVLAVSVRESLRVADKDLSEGGSTLGDETTTFGQRSTDVNMDAGSHTEWLTLSERLANIVLNPDHPIGQEFNNFTTLVLNKCHAIRTTVEGLIRKTPELDDRYMDYYVVGEKDVKVDKVVLEDMRIDILLHLWKISDHLTEYFENNEHLFVNKVRLSYEKCFFHRTGEEVMKLYRLVHSTSMKTIENRAKRVREYPICKLGLQMKDEWWLALLDNDDTSDVNEILSNDPDDNDDKSAVDDMGKMNPGNNTLEYFQRNLKFSKEKVLSKSLSNLNAVFDGHDYRREVDEMTKLIEARNRSVTVSIVEEEHVHQDTSKDGNKIVDNVEVRCISNKANSMMEIERASSNAKPVSSRRGSSKDTFRLHFGQTIKSIRNIFGSHGPLAKMQCLTSALKLLVDKVVELRMRDLDTDKCDRAKIAVSADDLLPLIVLMLLKLEPSEVGYLFVELIYISDLMAEFLAAGCHSYALTEFQIAFRVLDQTCEELEL